MYRELAVVVVAVMMVTAGCVGITSDSTDEPGTDGPETDTRGTGVPSTTETGPNDTQPTDGPEADTPTPTPTETPSGPSDPAEDRLGWENGYWYNESIDVTPEDGYNESEIDRILARSMARVERIRGLEFDETPEVSFIPRGEWTDYRVEPLEQFVDESLTTRNRIYQNTKFESLFVVPENESYYEDVIANRGGFAAAVYTTRGFPDLDVPERSIAIIVPEGNTSGVFAEETLGHELVHRLQDTNLGVLDTFRGGTTEEARNLNRGLTEGEATLVGQRYAERCEAEWDCLPEPDIESPERENFGLSAYSFGPYSETAKLFAAADERGGVEAMNAIYDNPPESTEQLLRPETYPDDTPTEIDYTDRSTDEWSRLFQYAPPETFGEMGIFLMLWYPSYDTNSTVVMDRDHLMDGVTPPSRADFTHPASGGWDGDEMVIYGNDSTAETNETGYVWETRWDSEAEAGEFASAYVQILTEYGTPVEGQENTYRIPEDHPYGDAFYVEQDGDAVTIVNAPSIEDLEEVHAPAGG